MPLYWFGLQVYKIPFYRNDTEWPEVVSLCSYDSEGFVIWDQRFTWYMTFQAMENDDEEEANGSKSKRGSKGKRRRIDDDDDDPKPKKRGRPAREKPGPKNKRLIKQLKRLMDIVIKYEDR